MKINLFFVLVYIEFLFAQRLYRTAIQHLEWKYIYIKQSVNFLNFRGKTSGTQGCGGNTLDKTIAKKKWKQGKQRKVKKCSTRTTKNNEKVLESHGYAYFYLYPISIIPLFVYLITLNSGETYKGFMKHLQIFCLNGNWLVSLRHLKWGNSKTSMSTSDWARKT